VGEKPELDRFGPRRRIGATALEVPVFGFGAAHIGELYAKVEEAQSRATLDAAWDSGVRLYDTAPWYGRGLSEHRLGGFLRTKPRVEFQVTTKVGRQLVRPKDPAHFDRSPWVGGLNFDVKWDYSYDGIMRSYEQALQRLSLDTVDALIIHDLDAGYHGDAFEARQKDMRETGVKALQELKRTGDIKAYGMGINTDTALEEVASQVDLDFCLVAMPYTLLDQQSLHRGMAALQRRGISVVIGAPLASGILATGSSGSSHYGYAKAPSEIQAKVRAIESVCKAHGVALPAAALQFVLAHPIVASVIPGAARPEEVIANAGHVMAKIPQGFWSDLKAQGLIDPEAPVP
jgi:D-threo-aldose 1-dehydrogenase